MKVKNIAFSGFMAAILMGVTGAHAAINVASQAYVDGKLKNKADAAAVTTLEGTVSTLSQTVADNKSSFDTYVTDNNAAVASKVAQSAYDTTVAALNQKDTEQDAAIALKADKSALEELAGDVYRKAQTYTRDEVAAEIAKTITDLETGGTIELGGYVKTQEMNDALDLKADKTQVATDIASAVTQANGYTDSEIAKLTAADGAITAAQAKADSAYALADAAQTAGEVQDAITGAITGLDLGNTYEAKGTAAGLDATLKTELQGEISAAQTAAEQKVTDLANGQVATNTSAIAANAEAITKKQDALDENQLAAAGSGITAQKVSEYDAAVSELSNKISMPEACKQANGNCVLGVIGGEVQWVDLTEPVDDEEQA